MTFSTRTSRASVAAVSDPNDLQTRFATAQSDVQKLSRAPETSDLLELYALFKQGTVGDVNTARPGMMDFKGRAKWDAWDKRRGMTREQAMQSYIALVEKLRAAG